jgi:cell division protein ZapE
MGAEDYLVIAKAYHTVFLEGVPKLNYDRRNEAKRLMTLIDAFYDNRIKLIVSADAAADKLYRGTDHAFEFQRTVSRLIEMQGADYLSAKNP